MLKALSVLTLAIAIAFSVLPQQTFAANTDSVTITVTISATVGVDISEGSYNFGPLSTGATESSSSSLTITNTGSGINETYSLNCSNTADWTAGETAGQNVFVLSAKFNSVAPVAFGAGDILTTTAVAASSSQFAGDLTGENVLYNEPRSLWLQLQTPTVTAAAGEQTITLTVTGAAS